MASHDFALSASQLPAFATRARIRHDQAANPTSTTTQDDVLGDLLRVGPECLRSHQIPTIVDMCGRYSLALV